MPTVSPYRKRRGAETQTALAGYLADHGFPSAMSTGSGRSGTDVTGTVGVCWECKARRDFSPMEWARQAAKVDPLLLPICVCRPDGMGVQTVADWPAFTPVRHMVRLLRLAGYGDPLPSDLDR